MAKLHKMVNGKKVDLTEEEEKAMREEWAKNALEANEARMAKKAQEEEKRLMKEKLAAKLDIKVEELELIIGK